MSGSTSSSAARRIFHSMPGSTATIRRKSHAASSCAVTSRTMRSLQRDISRLAACSRACPEEQQERIEAAARKAEFTIVRRRPVVFKEGEPPLVGLFLMMAWRDLPEPMRKRTWLEPPLIIRAEDGRAHAEYSVVKLAVGCPP
jgi:hypothetical protein